MCRERDNVDNPNYILKDKTGAKDDFNKFWKKR
jgi:hypothetical protein